ncbi:MAG TPA: carboxymuconolactone decarboxylase family protein [Propionibacteriaceae bacterium]|nr:carboxymuconolactone decarboxylase family protein [Propionibacteriaceae bacterium]
MSELSTSETPVLDLLASMTADSLEASSLDPQQIALVRIAALVASDAPPVSYALNLALASDLGLTPDDVRGVLTAIAPIVGTHEWRPRPGASWRRSMSPSRSRKQTWPPTKTR